VRTVTFWATVIAASSWLTRWETGALEPTQGHETAAAAGWAAVATPAAATVPPATRASAANKRAP
jgi:hypothetical protein